MAQNIDQTGNIIQASAFSIDTPDVFGSSGSKALTGNVSTAGGNITTATVTTTKYAGTVTMGATSGAPLTTSAGGTFVLTINNTNIGATDTVLASVAYASGSGGIPTIATIAPSAGAVVITVTNTGTTAFTANLAVSYAVFKA
jgi:hypothetical protein